MLKFLQVSFLMTFILSFYGCYSFDESKEMGIGSIIDASLDLEYHHSVFGAVKFLDYEKIKDISPEHKDIFNFSVDYGYYDYRIESKMQKIEDNIGVYIGLRDQFTQDSVIWDGNKNVQYIKSFRPVTMSGIGNLYYNLVYIFHLPSKLFHVIYFDIEYMDYNFLMIVWSIVKNTIYAIWGLLQAFIMLFVGTIVGFIIHPINSFTDIYHLSLPTLNFLWFGIKFIFIGY